MCIGDDLGANKRKRGKMREERRQRLASDVLSDVCEATISLDCLPRVIQSTIDSLKLNEAELTAEEVKRIGQEYKTIYDLLTLIQYTIYETDKKIEGIPIIEEPKKVVITSASFSAWLKDHNITPQEVAEAIGADLETAEAKIYDVNLFELSELKKLHDRFKISADLVAFYLDLERGQA